MKTLIAYGTKHGSVLSCAEALNVKLSGGADIVNLKKAKKLDLAQYDAVIIGGSIYASRIQKVVVGFCEDNLAVLKKKKLGLFICCMQEGEGAQKELEAVFPEELVKAAAAAEAFGGEFRPEKMGGLEKFLLKQLPKMDPNMKPVDLSKDSSTISAEKIEKFASAMK